MLELSRVESLAVAPLLLLFHRLGQMAHLLPSTASQAPKVGLTGRNLPDDLPNDQRWKSLGWLALTTAVLDSQGYALGPNVSLAFHFAVAIEVSGKGHAMSLYMRQHFGPVK